MPAHDDQDRLRQYPPVDIAYRYVVTAHGPDIAAGIAFRLLTYLIPLIGSLLAIMGVVLRDPDIRARTTEAIISLMPTTFSPSLNAAVTTTKDYAGWIGIVSVLMLFWIGSSLLGCLSRAFDLLYETPPRASVANRVVTLKLVLFIPPLFIATVLVSSGVDTFTGIAAAVFGTRIRHTLNADHMEQIVALATVWLLAFVLALTLFWGLPNAKQRFRDVCPGAALTAALLVVTNQLIPIYVRIALGNQYGAVLLLLAVATTWAYAVANVLLIGVAVNAFYYKRNASRHAEAALPKR